jgi:hypothetical protein
MKKLDLAVACYDFVRGPTGQRIVREVRRQLADPANRRHVVNLVGRLRARSSGVIVVDADPPDR